MYDEVLLEVPEEHAEKAVEVTHEAICKAFTMLFPEADTRNLADIGVGKSWAEAKGK